MNFNEEKTHIFNGFWKGKVIDNEDLNHSNRVKLRILGIHSQNNIDSLIDGIPDSNLPWAEQAGMFLDGSYVPAIGEWVWCFFDAGNYQKPVYFAKCRAALYATSPETDDLVRISKPKNNDTKEINVEGMVIKSAKTAFGRKIEIVNKESGAIIKLDSFNGLSRIVISADQIIIDGAGEFGGKGSKGYPIMAESPGAITIDGMPFRTSLSKFG